MLVAITWPLSRILNRNEKQPPYVVESYVNVFELANEQANLLILSVMITVAIGFNNKTKKKQRMMSVDSTKVSHVVENELSCKLLSINFTIKCCCSKQRQRTSI
ncbi:CLUMA_CG014570, isoform A [Clunio marinus]|uniref:CLUMA_CG014570, isoform A n=1 Tax=Clunio marinus TaxID=568069 RepID=A0A1J1ILM5_9DIPT|nr:CLUMA_CG014570, isoform A [Clunio marinus]